MQILFTDAKIEYTILLYNLFTAVGVPDAGWDVLVVGVAGQLVQQLNHLHQESHDQCANKSICAQQNLFKHYPSNLLNDTNRRAQFIFSMINNI